MPPGVPIQPSCPGSAPKPNGYRFYLRPEARRKGQQRRPCRRKFGVLVPAAPWLRAPFLPPALTGQRTRSTCKRAPGAGPFPAEGAEPAAGLGSFRFRFRSEAAGRSPRPAFATGPERPRVGRWRTWVGSRLLALPPARGTRTESRAAVPSGDRLEKRGWRVSTTAGAPKRGPIAVRQQELSLRPRDPG